MAGLCQDGALAAEQLTSLQKAALVFILMFFLEVLYWVWEDVYSQQTEAERGLARFGLTARCRWGLLSDFSDLRIL